MVVIQWTEEELVTFAETKSEHNWWSNSLSKTNGRIKHHEHFDCTMGRRQPKSARKINPQVNKLMLPNNLFLSTHRTSKEIDVLDLFDSSSVGG